MFCLQKPRGLVMLNELRSSIPPRADCSLQRDGLNDPFTGGLSSYGLVLMVAFALLRRDHFPPSPRGVCFADPRVSHRSASNLSSDLQSTPSADDVAQDQSSDELLQCQSLAEASSDGDHFTVPPSPDHADGSTSGSLFSPKIHGSPTRRSDMLSAGKQRGFWQRSSVLEGASDGTTGTFVDWSRAGTTKIRQPQAFAGDDGNMSCWDRYVGTVRSSCSFVMSVQGLFMPERTQALRCQTRRNASS